jgi:hypothetical protein
VTSTKRMILPTERMIFFRIRETTCSWGERPYGTEGDGPRGQCIYCREGVFSETVLGVEG